MTLFHGTRRNTLAAHAGLCLTSDVTLLPSTGAVSPSAVRRTLSAS